jgi:hypothetical protein
MEMAERQLAIWRHVVLRLCWTIRERIIHCAQDDITFWIWKKEPMVIHLVDLREGQAVQPLRPRDLSASSRALRTTIQQYFVRDIALRSSHQPTRGHQLGKDISRR